MDVTVVQIDLRIPRDLDGSIVRLAQRQDTYRRTGTLRCQNSGFHNVDNLVLNGQYARKIPVLLLRNSDISALLPSLRTTGYGCLDLN